MLSRTVIAGSQRLGPTGRFRDVLFSGEGQILQSMASVQMCVTEHHRLNARSSQQWSSVNISQYDRGRFRGEQSLNTQVRLPAFKSRSSFYQEDSEQLLYPCGDGVASSVVFL